MQEDVDTSQSSFTEPNPWTSTVSKRKRGGESEAHTRTSSSPGPAASPVATSIPMKNSDASNPGNSGPGSPVSSDHPPSSAKSPSPPQGAHFPIEFAGKEPNGRYLTHREVDAYSVNHALDSYQLWNTLAYREESIPRDPLRPVNIIAGTRCVDLRWRNPPNTLPTRLGNVDNKTRIKANKDLRSVEQRGRRAVNRQPSLSPD